MERVDLLAVKQQMASRMPLDQGKTYWTAMQRFFSAKLTRTELDKALDKLLPTSDLVALHNKLLHGVLFNTTCAALPPPGRHTGWINRLQPGTADDQRKRAGDDADNDDVNPIERKRRKLKHVVMRVGKHERAQIKAIPKVQKPKRPSLLDEMDSQGPQLLPNGLPVALEGVPHPPATLMQDYLRALATPLCCESRFLPSVDEMRDRMSLLAYETGLAEGVDPRAALLLNEAIDLHLKTILSSLFTLMRNSKERKRSNIERKIRTNDCEALFDITPALASQPHLGTIEKLMALPPPAPQSDDELDLPSSSSDEEERTVEQTSTIEDPAKASLSRRSSSKRPSKSSLRPRASSSSLNAIAAPKREALLIDPSVPGLAKPQHPDLVSPVPFGASPLSRSNDNDPGGVDPTQQGQSTNGRPASALASSASIGVAKSERDLQQELFPELNGSVSQNARSSGNGLTPSGDAATQQRSSLSGSALAGSGGAGGHSSDGSTDDEGDTSRRKDSTMGGQQHLSGALAQSGQVSGAAGATKDGSSKKKKKRRNLWEVVDSVKLLDGILD